MVMPTKLSPSFSISNFAINFSQPRSKLMMTMRLRPFCSNVAIRRCSITAGPTVLDLDHLPNPRTPWLMLPPETENDAVFERFYSPVDNQVVRLNREESLGVPNSAKCFASTRGWLGFVEPKGECPVYLTSPYRVKDVVQLPPLSTMPCILGVERDPKSGDVVRFKKWDCYAEDDEVEPYDWKTPEELVDMEAIAHLALSSSDPREETCVVAATQGGDRFETRLAYCPIGRVLNECENGNKSSDFECKVIVQDVKSLGYAEKQVIFSNRRKLFFAVKDDMIGAYDLHDENKRKRSQSEFFYWVGNDLYREYAREKSEAVKALREICSPKSREIDPYIVALENGDILCILRHYLDQELKEVEYCDLTGEERKMKAHKTVLFDVFRVDFYNMRLERLKSIGDRAIFIGSNQSFSLSARYYPEVQSNSIYFTDHTFGGMYKSCESGIFNMETGEIVPCYPFAEGEDKVIPSSSKNQLLWLSPS